MVKLIKDLMGCSGAELYPRNYASGTECPDDLIDAAIEVGAVDGKAAKAAAKAAADEAAAKAAAENA